MLKYTAKLSLLLLIIVEASINDEGVLSEGVLSGRSLCLDGVMYGGGFVRGGFVRGGFVRRGFCPTKAECLNTQFVSVFTSDDGKHLPDKGLSPYREMDTIQFTQPGIEIILKNIDQMKATGLDELPARILKETCWCTFCDLSTIL